MNEFKIDSKMRVDVFKALRAAKENIDKGGNKLTSDEARLVEKTLLDGKRNGLDLPEETRAKVTEVCVFLFFKCLLPAYGVVPLYLPCLFRNSQLKKELSKAISEFTVRSVALF